MNEIALSSEEKKQLIQQSHALNPSVTIADNGLSVPVMKEIAVALEAKPLIKLKFSGYDAREKKQLVAEVLAETGAQLIQLVGHVAVIYRPED